MRVRQQSDGKLLSSTVLSAVIGVFGIMVFFMLWRGSQVLFTTDDNIGINAMLARSMPASFGGWWSHGDLLGVPGAVPLNWTFSILFLFGPVWFTNWVHAVDLFFAAIFLLAFLRSHGASIFASAIGCISSFWVGTNFTLLYAGHTGKFGLLLFAAVFLWSIQRAVHGICWPWFVVAGMALGGMLLEQQDVAILMGVAFGAYVVFLIVRMPRRRILALIGASISLVCVSILLSGGVAINAYVMNVDSAAVMQETIPFAKWEFVTQWSQPPDETIDLIAPGYMGLRSGEPDGPYWGRAGRSAGWEKTGQGFMNFRLESQYIGAIPIAFAMFAVVAALLGKKEEFGSWPVDRKLVRNIEGTATSTFQSPAPLSWSDRRAEILFWGAVAVITLMLAWGKYFPLYALFYKLPVVNNIRNPIKFIQVFQLALGILAAYGLDVALRWRREGYGLDH